MLYSQQDYIDVIKARKWIWIALIFSTVVSVCAIIISLIFRIKWIGYTFAVLWAIFFIFLWDTKVIPIKKYSQLLEDMEKGLEKTITGIIESIESQITIKDMLEFHLVVFNQEGADKKQPPRNLYIDASKKTPELKKGAELELTLFNNYIKDIKLL